MNTKENRKSDDKNFYKRRHDRDVYEHVFGFIQGIFTNGKNFVSKYLDSIPQTPAQIFGHALFAHNNADQNCKLLFPDH